MKVVLFCGGLGTRLRDYSDAFPKPLVDVGPRPIIWHLMKYYAHYGHTDFILCLGPRRDGDQAVLPQLRGVDDSNDFMLSNGRQDRRLPVHATSTTGGSRSSTPVPTP